MQKEINNILAVAETKNISRAADELFVSQSSLSRSIASLEKELGFSLFKRTNNGIEPTEAGEIYIRYARKIRYLYGKMQDDIQEMHENTCHQIRIGFSLNAGTFSVRDIKRPIEQKYPNVELHCENVLAKDIPEGLYSGRLDTVISSEIISEDFSFQKICDEHLCLLVPESLDISSVTYKKEGFETLFIQPQDLPVNNLILQSKDTGIRKTIDRLISVKELTIQKATIAHNTTVGIQFVEDQIGCLIIISSFLHYVHYFDKLKVYFIDGVKVPATGFIRLKSKAMTEEELFCHEIISRYILDHNRRIFPR